MDLPQKVYSFLYLDEKLFGNKKFLIIEQLNCKKNIKLRNKIHKKIIHKQIEEAILKMQNSNNFYGKANHIVVSPSITKYIRSYVD